MSLERAIINAYRKVSKALTESGVEFRREGLRYDIPNFGLCYEKIVRTANEALRDTFFYAQEMPYREMLREDERFTPQYMLVLMEMVGNKNPRRKQRGIFKV